MASLGRVSVTRVWIAVVMFVLYKSLTDTERDL